MSGSFIQQASPILSTGVIELVGINEQVEALKHTASVEIPLDVNGPASGEILSMMIIAREVGSGAILLTEGELLLFDSDPAIALNATQMAVLDVHKIVGSEVFLTADWGVTDTNGAWAWKAVSVAFSKTKSLWASFLVKTGETTINSAAGDDETLELIMRYRRDT